MMNMWRNATSFVSSTSSILQSADLGEQSVDFHRDKFILFPFIIKVGIPPETCLLQDIFLGRFVVRGGMNLQ